MVDYQYIIVVEDSLTTLLFNCKFPLSEGMGRGLLSPFILQRVLIFQEVISVVSSQDFPPE